MGGWGMNKCIIIFWLLFVWCCYLCLGWGNVGGVGMTGFCGVLWYVRHESNEWHIIQSNNLHPSAPYLSVGPNTPNTAP